MLARPSILSMSDAQHYISTPMSNREPLSDYLYQLRLACLNNGEKTKLFSQRLIERQPNVGVRAVYTQHKVIDWPFEGLERRKARHYRNLIDAARGRLAVVADDTGSVAFQMPDQTVHQPALGFNTTALSINSQSMQTICCTSLGSLVAISSNLERTQIISEEEQLFRPTSLCADPTNRNFTVVATEDSCAALVDSRLPARASISYRVTTHQKDGIAQVSPSGTFFSVYSPKHEIVELFDVRVGRRFNQLQRCVASQWVPNCAKTLTVVDRDRKFNNYAMTSATKSSVVKNVMLEKEVVDFCWDSSGKLLLAFLTDSNKEMCTMAVCTVTRNQHSHWQTLGCERDCVDFTVDRHEHDKAYLGSSCETITAFNFVQRIKTTSTRSRPRLLPKSTIKYTIR